PGNGDWQDIAGYIQVADLTIIGSGPDVTTIRRGMGENDISRCFVKLDSGAFSVSGLTITDFRQGMFVIDSELLVDHCDVLNGLDGIIWACNGVGGRILNSNFHLNTNGSSIGLFAFGLSNEVVVENCIFDTGYLEIQGLDLTVSGCEVYGCRVGLQLSNGANCSIYDSSFHDIDVTAIVLLSGGPICRVIDSTVAAGIRTVKVNSSGNFESLDSVFWGGSSNIFILVGECLVKVRYCLLFNGGGDSSIYCLITPFGDYFQHDFRGNYWGTDDSNQIAAWIWDVHDDPDHAYAEILYTPFATGDSDLVIGLSPSDPEIIIPETGGSFLYDASIENNTGTDIVADLTIEAVLPDGTAYPVMDLPGVVLAGASVRTRIDIVQEVPAAAPAGTYTYRVSASLGDTLLVDTAELPFEKQGGAVAAVGAMSWPVTGWLDEDRPPFQSGAVKPVLYGPVPNPFNPTTTVAFELPAQEAVSLHVFDLQGRLVRTLLSGEVVPQGRHEAVWDGRDASGRQAASGTYFFRLEAGGQVETKRAVLVK
ncbi:MAG: FlgD immunoglobulin-like domain containing protein, partial [bacterium]